MTDETGHDQLGGFRTPLAAGMLSGVLAGVVAVAIWYVGTRFVAARTQLELIFAGPTWMDILLPFPWYTLLCCGPAIAHRRWKLAGHAFLWALALSPVNTLLVGADSMFMFFFRESAALTLWWTVRAVLSGSLLGLVLTWLYGYKPYSAWAPVLGAVASVAMVLGGALLDAQHTSRSIEMSMTREYVAAQTMLGLIGSVAMATAPALAIEWDLKRRARRAALLGKVSPKTEGKR